jgi:hypothetical protein
MTRVFGALSLAALLVAAWFSTVLARADHAFRQATQEGVSRASALLPRNTTYLSLFALQIEYAGGDPTGPLERQTKLTPFASAPRIRLGLDAEGRGDAQAAEKWLLDAAQVDRQFEPAWTLANFYFRQQKFPEFWKWIRNALAVSYGDRSPAFDLCWNASSDPGEIYSRAIPDSHDVTEAYLSYLLQRHLLAALPQAAMKLAEYKDVGAEADAKADDGPALDGAADELIEGNQFDAALKLWTASGHGGDRDLRNGFARAGHGFDWRFVQAPGVSHVELDSADAHRIVMNGQEPESTELMRRYVHLKPGVKQELNWEARLSAFPKATGLSWRIGEAAAPIASSEDFKADRFEFTPAREWMPLTLNYQRPSGETRVDGTVELRNVRLGNQ